MDLKKFNPEMFSASNEDLAGLTKEQILQIAGEYKKEPKNRLYLTAEYKSPYERKFRSSNFTWTSLEFMIHKGYVIENLRLISTIQNKREQVIGELPNELEENPLHLKSIEKETPSYTLETEAIEEVKAEVCDTEPCCGSPEDCIKPQNETITEKEANNLVDTSEAVPRKPIALEDLDKEDMKILLKERGVKFHHKLGKAKLLKLLQETENK